MANYYRDYYNLMYSFSQPSCLAFGCSYSACLWRCPSLSFKADAFLYPLKGCTFQLGVQLGLSFKEEIEFRFYKLSLTMVNSGNMNDKTNNMNFSFIESSSNIIDQRWIFYSIGIVHIYDYFCNAKH